MRYHFALCLIFLCLSYCGTGLFCRYALKKGLMDLPNQRGSHTIPTPRGGGLVFVILACASWIGLLVWQYLNQSLLNIGNVYFLLTSLLIAILGFIDDNYPLSAKVRLIFQLSVFSVFLYWLLEGLLLNNQSYNTLNDNIWAVLFLGFSCLFLLWLTNLYNFMDGINGLATVEAIFFLASTTLFYHDFLFFPLFQNSLGFFVPYCLGF